MGFFSWITGDTKRSIANSSSDRETFTVYMLTADGRSWEEDSYEGYGEFGGKDIYELIAELNDLGTDRSAGIDLCHEKGNDGDFGLAAENGYNMPKLVEQKVPFDQAEYPGNCPDQGFFYDDEDEDERNDDYYDGESDED